jgi:hypothetical protein
MPKFEVLITTDEYNRIKKSGMNYNQICRLGIQYAEEICGLLPEGRRVLCLICNGLGIKADMNTYKMKPCQACNGTGVIYEKK